MSSPFFKIVKTIVLYVYNETVPVRKEKLVLLHSSVMAKLRHGAGVFTQSAAFGSLSPLTPLRALLSF